MTWLWLFGCFVVALLIYFGKYYEEDKKAFKGKKYPENGNQGEEYLVPFLDEPQGSHREVTGSNQEDFNSSDGENI